MRRVFILLCLFHSSIVLYAQKPLSLVNTFYATLENYVLYNDHIEYQNLMNMCDAGFRISDRFAQEQSDIPSQSLLLQNYLELLREKQVKLAISDMREITLSNHRTEGAPTKTVLVSLTLSSPKTSTYKLQNIVYIRNNKIFCIGDYEVDRSDKVLIDVVNKTDITSNKHNNIHNGHEYVDLGLSVMWATCNVGAESPEDYGGYFQWGHIKPTTVAWWWTYKWCTGARLAIPHVNAFDGLTKYCCTEPSKKHPKNEVDNKKLLDLSDDAARVNWGSSWRIPTQAEQDELVEKCTWTKLTYGLNGYKGVSGYKVTSKINGNSIFLPCAGYLSMTDNDNKYSGSYFWSSSLGTGNSNYAYGLRATSNGIERTTKLRCYGLSVRPVFSQR